jgi:hypothetical protein
MDFSNQVKQQHATTKKDSPCYGTTSHLISGKGKIVMEEYAFRSLMP